MNSQQKKSESYTHVSDIRFLNFFLSLTLPIASVADQIRFYTDIIISCKNYLFSAHLSVQSLTVAVCVALMQISCL